MLNTPSPTPKLKVDPTGHYPDVKPTRLLGAGGFVFFWAAEAFTRPESIRETLENRYGFGSLFPMDMTISPTGVLSYPEDPDLYPLFSITGTRPGSSTEEVFYMYEHAIVAFSSSEIDSKNGFFISRMD